MLSTKYLNDTDKVVIWELVIGAMWCTTNGWSRWVNAFSVGWMLWLSIKILLQVLALCCIALEN